MGFNSGFKGLIRFTNGELLYDPVFQLLDTELQQLLYESCIYRWRTDFPNQLVINANYTVSTFASLNHILTWSCRHGDRRGHEVQQEGNNSTLWQTLPGNMLACFSYLPAFQNLWRLRTHVIASRCLTPHLLLLSEWHLTWIPTHELAQFIQLSTSSDNTNFNEYWKTLLVYNPHTYRGKKFLAPVALTTCRETYLPTYLHGAKAFPTRSSASLEIPRILWNPKVHYYLTGTRHLSLSWARSIQPVNPIPLLQAPF